MGRRKKDNILMGYFVIFIFIISLIKEFPIFFMVMFVVGVYFLLSKIKWFPEKKNRVEIEEDVFDGIELDFYRRKSDFDENIERDEFRDRFYNILNEKENEVKIKITYARVFFIIYNAVLVGIGSIFLIRKPEFLIIILPSLIISNSIFLAYIYDKSVSFKVNVKRIFNK